MTTQSNEMQSASMVVADDGLGRQNGNEVARELARIMDCWKRSAPDRSFLPRDLHDPWDGLGRAFSVSLRDQPVADEMNELRY